MTDEPISEGGSVQPSPSEPRASEGSSPEVSTSGASPSGDGGGRDASIISSADVAREFAGGGDAESAPPAESTGEPGAPKGERKPAGAKKRRRKKSASPGGGGGNANQPNQGGRESRQPEDQLDRDAEQLARDARSVPHQRLRPIANVSRQVRRLLASNDPRDAREARRALVLAKSKLAYLAGREVGRERASFVKVRDSIFKGIDRVVGNRENLDPRAARNLLDHLDAFVGYHRFHSDDRRRDG